MSSAQLQQTIVTAAVGALVAFFVQRHLAKAAEIEGASVKTKPRKSENEKARESGQWWNPFN